MTTIVTQTTTKVCSGMLSMRRLGKLLGTVQCKRNGQKDEWMRYALLSAATA